MNRIDETLQNTIPVPEYLEKAAGCATDDILFFDIETTGLSAHSSSVYLIGCLSVDNNSFVLHQFMAESFSEEQQIILEFLDLLKVTLRTE